MTKRKKYNYRPKGDRLGWRRVGVLERKTLKQVLGGVEMVSPEYIFEYKAVKAAQ